MKRLLFSFLATSTLFQLSSANPPPNEEPPEVRLGERLFREPRFAQRFFAQAGEGVNAPIRDPEPALARLPEAANRSRDELGPFAGQTMSCRACHLVDDAKARRGLPGGGVSTYADFTHRSPVPERDDGMTHTSRNSPALVDVLSGPATLLHYDGEFATPEALVMATYTGRNFGWMPQEAGLARSHFARVIREDDGSGELAQEFGSLSYAVALRSDGHVAAEWRLPPEYRLEVDAATDDEILVACARLVAAYLRSLQFSRAEGGWLNGSPYDAFLEANGVPRGPEPGETNEAYAQRLHGLIARLATPKFIDDEARALRYHEQQFRFGPLEWEGLRLFFRRADPAMARKGEGAGNCAACHTPPHFTDFKFHNTGASQDEYDAVHGAGAFVRLEVPALAQRAAEPARWLPANEITPDASGVFASAPERLRPERADLGLWNVFGNPAAPDVQAMLERALNPRGELTSEVVLASALGRFKTPSLRDLGQSPPYLHSGRFDEIEDVLRFYVRMSQLAHAGKLRNPPPEFAAMRLSSEDVEALAAFLRALNEDYD